ncbi:MAG: ABC transporter ATP-binding protein [Zetaproteobacteria bacterium]|nr:MAG: ABC transporter ATP-binding protein [Zetaproteobacteria bacterium]
MAVDDAAQHRPTCGTSALSDTLLTIHDLRVEAGGRAILDGINLSVPKGHFLGIVGPNGAGKSTLINALVGLQRPDHGHIDLFGQCLKPFNRRQLLRHVGFLHQLHEQQPRLPVRVCDVVMMGLGAHLNPLVPMRRYRQRIIEALRLTDMEHAYAHDYRTLSGGQRQRVRLARALVRRPKLLLLDEPSAALDSKRQEKLYLLLRRLCDEQGMGVIMVDHDIAAISSHVDSVACLNRRIHFHASRGEPIPDHVWQRMYGEHIQLMAHDAACIGCTPAEHS